MLLRFLFPHFKYVTLESPDQLLIAKADPRSFLKPSELGIIIDEAQNCSELFSYIQEIVDVGNASIKIILSGSQNFLLAEKISQTLAGRVALLELLPLTYDEMMSDEASKLPSLYEHLYRGAYPRPYHEKLPKKLFLTMLVLVLMLFGLIRILFANETSTLIKTIAGAKAISLSLGSAHQCALMSNGDMLCWGDN